MPPTPLTTTDWPRLHAGQSRAARLVRTGGTVFILLVALALLAAWCVPPLLDWGRFRGSIAAIAAAQLGRPVLIRGEVTLRLLPEAVLTAANVSLPPVRDAATHRTDGISAQLGTLRLQVAIWPLLAGRVVVRDLTLGAPVLSLPWPLPASIAHPARPRLPHEFAAHMENGTLRIGGLSMTGITAVLHGNPAPPSQAGGQAGGEANPPGTFEAEGFARFAGHDWRFASALGAPDADGVSAIDLSMRMLMPAESPAPGAAEATGATIRATLADGVVQGRLHASGPDLADLLSRHADPAAPPLDWQAEAPFVVTGAGIETGGLSLSLGDTVMRGSAALHFGDAAMLEASLSSPALDLDQWTPLWEDEAGTNQAGPNQAGGAGPDSAIATGVGLHLVLAADSARLSGGVLHDLHAILRSDGTHLRLDQAGAILPGDARLTLGPASLRARSGRLDLAGPVSLAATDAHAALRWLWPGPAAWLAGLPQAAMDVTLHGSLTLAPGRLTLEGMSGVIGGTALSGALNLRQGARPAIDLALTIDHPALDHLASLDWPAGTRSLLMAPLRADAVLPALAALDRHLGDRDGTLDLHLTRPTWHGHRLDDLALALHAGAPGLTLDRLTLGVDGVGLAASGAITRDGVVKQSRLALQAAHLANMASLLPADWRWPSSLAGLPLLHSAGILEMAAQGSLSQGGSSALAWQMRADAGDLVIEADATSDILTAETTATLTLRHPGAPRLLAALGMAGTEAWIGTGSVALVAHVKLAHGDIAVPDFTLNAADMRLAGSLDLANDGPAPRLSGHLRADLLALPAISPDIGRLPPWLARQLWLADLDSDLTLHAASVTLAQRPALMDLAMTLRAGQGVIFASPLAARLADGASFTGALAIDTTQSPPAIAARATLKDVAIAYQAASLPIDPTAGMLDLTADLQAAGSSRPAILASLEGTLRAALHDGTLKGFDLRQFGASRRRTARQKALATGASPGLDGFVDASLTQGHLTLRNGLLRSADGQVSLSGGADLPGGDLNLEFGLTPSAGHADHATLRLTGPATNPKLTPWRPQHQSRNKKPPQPATTR